MLNRNELKKLSNIRIKEAKALITSGNYNGAYYLAGYSVECAIKACIAKKTRRYEFPSKELANKVWTHNLDELIKLAELRLEFDKDIKANKSLELNWAVVKDWSESTRYQPNISDKMTLDYYSACTARKNGILSWIKKRW